MRLHEHIYLLKGSRRHALYNLSLGFAAPLNRREVKLVKTLAEGKDPLRKGISHLFPSLRRLRNLGALEAGRPAKKSLELEGYFKLHKKSTGAPGITQVWIELTNSCNLLCEHCYTDAKPDPGKDELSFEQWVEILKPLLESGTRKVTFIGGEPMMRYSLMKKLVEYIRKSAPTTSIAIFSNLTTNLDKNFIEYLREHNIIMNTSLYSARPGIHDHFTGKEGSWEKTIGNIKTLRNSGVEMFTGFIQLPEDKATTKEIRDFIQNLDVTSFDIYSASKVGRGVKREWKELPQKNRPPSRVHFNPDHLHARQYFHNCFSNSIAITPRGDVLPCIMMRGINYGNALNQEIHNLLQNDDFSLLSRLTKDQVDGCSQCEFRYACFDCRPDSITGANLYEKSNCGYRPDNPL